MVFPCHEHSDWSEDGRSHRAKSHVIQCRVRSTLRTLASAFLVSTFAGCSLPPVGTADEQARLRGAAESFEAERLVLPELPASPTWRDILHRAFLANGDLQRAYFEWKAAVERVGIASAYPNANFSLGYAYTFSRERMKSFDRMTFSAGFDSMENLSYPGKVLAAGRVALDEARAAGERFRATKFDLQRRVLVAWADWALLAEKARIAREQFRLSGLVLASARGRLRAGGAQKDLLRAEVAYQTAENALKEVEADLIAASAGLNGLLARETGVALEPPASLPEPRPLPVDDARLIALGVEANPELTSLAWQVRGRADALELARLQWIPDVNPSAVFTGGIAQALGAAIILPTAVAEIRGRIREAQSELRSSEAALRQAGRDRAASFVATLVSLRNAEREASLFEGTVLPAAEEVLGTVTEAYVSGSESYLDLIESQGMLLEARLAIAEARMRREKRLAELEALAGTDVESLADPPGGEPRTAGEDSPDQPDTRRDGVEEEDHHE